jgi:hypothetical protein
MKSSYLRDRSEMNTARATFCKMTGLVPLGAAMSRTDFCPWTRAMLRELKSFPLLDGFRRQPQSDVSGLLDLMVVLSSTFLS